MKPCNQCGKCCIRYGGGGLSASADEIDQWENYHPDIFAYVKDGEIWCDPETGEQLTRCPWLEKLPDQPRYICGIYEVRPDDCRYYPTRIEEMIRDECEMLETRDATDPAKAQKALDDLMSDSRPPYR